MKESRFSENGIIRILKEHDAGKKAKGLCREYGISDAAFYNWKKEYGGMDATQLKKPKELEEENRRLKRMCADLGLDHGILKDVIEKKL